MQLTKIEHIDQVLPSVQGRDDFIVVKKDGYTVIDYVYAGKDTFDDPIRLECRGIKFREDGYILSRPLHKFFNIGEKQSLEDIDFSEPHEVMEKLDGSMIHTAVIDDEVHFITRMGITDHAITAKKRHMTPDIEHFARACADFGWTPVFEWTAPDNRIVLPYEKSELTLLALRTKLTGHYFGPKNFDKLFHCTIKTVKTYNPFDPKDSKSMYDSLRRESGIEGRVIRFADGHHVKVKCDEYVLHHKVMSDFRSKRKMIELILDGGVDDILPIIPKDFVGKVHGLMNALHLFKTTVRGRLTQIVIENAHLDQKSFALGPAMNVPSEYRFLLFLLRKGADIETEMNRLIFKYPELVQFDY